MHHLKPLLAYPEGSIERAAAVDTLAGAPLLDWRQKPVTLSRATIYRRLAELERGAGMASLARKRREDAGAARVVISRAWDEAVPFDAATKRKIADNLRLEIRSRRAQRMSRKWVLATCREWLKKDTAAHGFKLADPHEFERICTIPVALYTAEAKYEQVYDLTKDRDRFDNKLPRIRRTIEGMRPMELVVADVHPTDLLIQRSDGTVGAARLLAFMDIATRRVRAELVMIEGAGGVRNVDGIKAFVAMATDQAWGLPEQFYVDNGSEYLFADYLDDALALTGRGADRRIIRALPYNAAAKPIEAWFHRFEADHMRHVPGWHGGKLGAPKRPARGKLPSPFEGGFDALNAIIQGHIQAYNAINQPGGELGKDSPTSRFARHVTEGWAATLLDPSQLLTVFTRTETRIVRQHGISVDGRHWSCPELDAYLGSTVTVKVPVLGIGFNELWIGDEAGNPLGIARPDVKRTYTDQRQAMHSADRKATTMAAVRALKRQVKAVDVGAEIVDFGAGFPVPVNPPAGVVSVSDGQGAEIAIFPTPGPSRQDAEEQENARWQLEALRERRARAAERKP